MQINILKQKIKKIKKKVFKHSCGEWDGLYKSKTKGTGLQFKEHQIYNYGDEIRFIDWKLFAKTNRPYIKTFEEERNVCIEYVIDLNNNLFVGYDEVFKIDALIDIFSLMALVAKKFNDQISLSIIYDKLYRFEVASGEKIIFVLLKFLEKIGLIDSDGRWNISYQKKVFVDNKKVNSLVLKAISKHRPVFFFMSSFNEISCFKKYYKYKNFHPFMILSPVEYSDRIPFSIKVNVDGKSENRKTQTLNSDISINSKYIKLIKMDIDYIESFMKHVL